MTRNNPNDLPKLVALHPHLLEEPGLTQAQWTDMVQGLLQGGAGGVKYPGVWRRGREGEDSSRSFLHLLE